MFVNRLQWWACSHHHHHRQHYIGDKRPMLHCHTTIWGRKYLAVMIEGVGGVDLNTECLFIRQNQGAYTLKQTNYHANAEYRRGQDIISETVSLRLSMPQRHYKPYCPYDTAQHSPYTPSREECFTEQCRNIEEKNGDLSRQSSLVIWLTEYIFPNFLN